MKIPVKITPDTILEAIIEIRFSPNIPGDAVFGAIYGNLRGEFSGYEALNALQIPEAIRQSDPSLTFAPLYRIQHDDILLQIGPRVLTFNNPGAYLGWESLSGNIKSLLEKILKLDVIKSVERIGLRYINFFPEQKILENANLKIEFPNFQSITKSHNIRMEYFDNDIQTVLQVLENATVSQNTQGSDARNGSIVDIDCIKLYDSSDSIDVLGIMGNLDKAHKIEKNLFFNLLKTDYIEKLNPVYEN